MSAEWKGSGFAWTSRDDAQLRELWLQGELIEDIAAQLKRTPSSIQTRARRLGLPPRRDVWTAEQDALLTELWTSGVRRRDIAARIGRPEPSVRARAKRLELLRPGRHVFTPAEEAFLRRHYQARGARWCAEQLGLRPPQIHRVASRLGIADERLPLDEEHLDAFIRAKNAIGWSDTEIATAYCRRRPHTDRHVISTRRRDMGLPFQGFSERQRRQTARRTAAQCQAAGVRNLAEIRARAYRCFARRHGWPEDLRPRAVQILDVLWARGPMTRPEIAAAIGLPWLGSRKSLCSNDPGGSYLAHLVRRGLVVRMPRARRVLGRGGGRSMDVYALALHVEKKPCDERSA